ncbi:hypothetical protein [Paraburkholderia sabiae]|jgi:hypothetical protein|uniref:hypothetical protein n=1 Tax=Paraburkholderia sabiae TaxID=273251 RepID=UPI001CC402FC|nr:hypothetical protein [Paraburkholderia sabiae]
MSEPSVLFACCRSAGSIGFTSASASAQVSCGNIELFGPRGAQPAQLLKFLAPAAHGGETFRKAIVCLCRRRSRLTGQPFGP